VSAGAEFEALGTGAGVVVEDAGRLPAVRSVVESELRAVDEACSRFRSDSELSALNAAAGSPVAVGELLAGAIEVALRAAAATGGAVDPTVGRSIRGLGWDQDFSVVVHRESPARVEIVPAAGWRSVRLDRSSRRVMLPAGVELDLGATAKAFAADRCARRAHEVAACGVLVNLGGDIAVQGEPPRGGWPLLVTDDHRAGVGASGQTVSIASGGLATSSTGVRRWRAGDGTYHHIVDPRTGRSCVEHWQTVTVAALDCVQANAASTAAIVLGREAPAWLERRGLPARLVAPDGSVALTAGWPP
jgi:thiamine biosynthesis lipoprotein